MANRREFLAGIGTVGTITIAGCNDEVPEQPEDPVQEPEEELEEEESEEEPEPEEEPSRNDIEIIEYDESVKEYESASSEASSERVSVSGIASNNADTMARYVILSVKVYDSNGDQLGNYTSSDYDVDTGEWEFATIIRNNSENIDNYEIEVDEVEFYPFESS